jgi:hypothetical protein
LRRFEEGFGFDPARNRGDLEILQDLLKAPAPKP